ncbi:MAG: FecR domain-containing protein [Pseudomonadota bacterium]
MSSQDKERLLEEAADLYLRLKEDPKNEVLRRELERFLARGPKAAKAFADIEESWAVTGGRPRPINPVLAVLGIGLLCLGALGFDRSRIYLTADHIAPHQPLSVELASGDFAVLDATSAITDETQGATRHVGLLRGAIYVDVTPRSEPFVVTAGDVSVEVVGTTFEVARYRNTVQVKVESGQVLVEREGQQARLSAGESLTWEDDSYSIRPVEESNVASWRSAQIVVDGQSFAQVAEILDRRIPGPVVIMDRELSASPVSGTFDLSRPLVSLRNLAASHGGMVISTPPVSTLVIGR